MINSSDLNQKVKELKTQGLNIENH